MSRRPWCVYVGQSAMLLHRPGRITYHEKGRHRFGQYVPDPDKPGTSKRIGSEKGWTRCGLVTYDETAHYEFRMEAIRRDVGELIGRPCRSCRRLTRRENL